MTTCKTCKFWKEDNTKKPFGICTNVGGYDEQYPHNSKDDNFCIFADASDDTGLTSDLLTKENFGCNMHKEKHV